MLRCCVSHPTEFFGAYLVDRQYRYYTAHMDALYIWTEVCARASVHLACTRSMYVMCRNTIGWCSSQCVLSEPCCIHVFYIFSEGGLNDKITWSWCHVFLSFDTTRTLHHIFTIHSCTHVLVHSYALLCLHRLLDYSITHWQKPCPVHQVWVTGIHSESSTFRQLLANCLLMYVRWDSVSPVRCRRTAVPPTLHHKTWYSPPTTASYITDLQLLIYVVFRLVAQQRATKTHMFFYDLSRIQRAQWPCVQSSLQEYLCEPLYCMLIAFTFLVPHIFFAFPAPTRIFLRPCVLHLNTCSSWLALRVSMFFVLDCKYEQFTHF
jgi:hypothetical protein